ncbi:MAG: tRNA pseudouridine(55) synthase TruB [Bacilli bacterium]|nr:tRNA pseudouridine(55) synthase TruB [Bacilli bacterium]
MTGILVINKKAGMTSRDVVNEVGKLLHTKKIGHTGTLDPMATGVLVLCVGKATKIAELLTATEKEYVAEITLGIETDTLDNTGTILKQENVSCSKEQIENVLKSMVGEYLQEVPLYSAIHVDGKKLYEYARNHEEVKLPSRIVTIYSLELVQYTTNKFTIRTKVSKGTYIRSLIRDIAKKLNTIGVMSKLERTQQGIFPLKDSVTIENIKNHTYSILSIKDALISYPMISVNQELEKKIKNGQIIKNEFGKSIILFLNGDQEPLALYKVYPKDEEYLKPWKMF